MLSCVWVLTSCSNYGYYKASKASSLRTSGPRPVFLNRLFEEARQSCFARGNQKTIQALDNKNALGERSYLEFSDPQGTPKTNALCSKVTW